MQKQAKREGRIALDRRKLLGFRNLIPTNLSETETSTNPEVAFTKIGTEACDARFTSEVEIRLL